MAFFAGCSDDFLDKEPIDSVSENAVFSDEGFAESYLYNVYDFLPSGFGNGASNIGNGDIGYGDYYNLSTVCDEARNKSGWISSQTTVVPGLISPTNNPLGLWGESYTGVRRANHLIEGLESSALDEVFIKRVIAEARYVRAWLYFDLVRRYGDVPLITVVQNIDDGDALLVSRTPASEIYAFIDAELEEIAEDIPLAVDFSDDKYGRVNRETVWALSSRSNLYAENYEKAASSAKKIMDGNHFSLSQDLNALFQSESKNPEVIFEILFQLPFKGHSWDRVNLPFSWRTDWGSQVNPVQELVDEFEMADTGLPVTDPASGYDPQNPYEGRDKRFYASILYHDAPFKGGVVDAEYLVGAEGLLANGLTTITGYYVRKFLDESLPFDPNFSESKCSWKEFRLAEILLNYAEAQNEAVGPDASVYSAINQLRSRAGLPDLLAGLSQDEMREKIKHERRVELCFENHRYFDLIRWGIAEETLNDKFFHGMKITRDADDNLVFDPTFLVDMRPKQIFLPKHNLMPLPQSEIEKNPNLLPQNEGY